MRSISIDDLIDLLEQLVELVPYGSITGRVGREGIGKREERKKQFMREGQQPRGRGRLLLVVGNRWGRDLEKRAEGAILALCGWRGRDEVAELGR